MTQYNNVNIVALLLHEVEFTFTIHRLFYSYFIPISACILLLFNKGSPAIFLLDLAVFHQFAQSSLES